MCVPTWDDIQEQIKNEYLGGAGCKVVYVGMKDQSQSRSLISLNPLEF